MSGNAKAPDGALQARIIAELGVAPDFDAAAEIERRWADERLLGAFELGLARAGSERAHRGARQPHQ